MTKTSVLNYCTFQSEQENQKKRTKKNKKSEYTATI